MREKFNNWVEPDVAMFYLAEELGIIEPTQGNGFHNSKWAFASNSVYSNELWKMLLSMVDMGFLEICKDDEFHNNFRWKQGADFIK